MFELLIQLRAGDSNNSNLNVNKTNVNKQEVAVEQHTDYTNSMLDELTGNSTQGEQGQTGGMIDNETTCEHDHDSKCVSTKSRKLVSGKCTRPNELDIKQVVKYVHEKLDSRHVQDKVFDSLPFHLLVASELELASLRHVST